MDIYNRWEEHETNVEMDKLDQMDDLEINIADAESPTDETSFDHNEISSNKGLIANVRSKPTKDFYRYLCDAPTTHAFVHTVSPPINSRYSSSTFYGVEIDTWCALASTCGAEQYKAYCNWMWRGLKVSHDKSENIKFEIVLTTALGSAKCSFPVEDIWFTIVVYVIEADVPMLLTLADMDRLNTSYEKNIDILTNKSSGARAHIERKCKTIIVFT